ncbi:GlxA family transcriptional regulator [Ancylobacter amanitiformis]|uniref:Transcriptional regulator GlxA family with amidase domain n=1 Tax=Ancylobacter amanitiformis TaxID=217069 RepID=A0ABU0LNS3_9HYPH|nr:GlxA family transcriptional regulator [Ancylobacter amanitiformis]MDQ0510352.1 transcriptional regulator GlxA family with amidase domain [Ancylobacter amanitiformis]
MLSLATLSHIGFLTLPNHSMIACANALEALRMANYVAEAALYSWRVVTLDGTPAPASNGLTLSPTVALAEAGPLDLIIVCGGTDIRHAATPAIADALRRLGRRGTALGALCTGSFVLAEAGLLDFHRCAVHWENLSAIREEFPEIDFVEEAFVIDRDRLTCTGGVAPLAMMLALIEAKAGRALADKVSEQFIVDPAGRRSGERIAARPRPALPDPTLARAVRLMERAIERPPGIAAIARRLDVSPRHLERLFRRHLGVTPAAYHLGLRLERARELLRLSPLPVTDVGLACGFQSAAHFSTAYARRFGRPPSAERRPRAAPVPSI